MTPSPSTPLLCPESLPQHVSEWLDAVVPGCHGSGETDVETVLGHRDEFGGVGPGPRVQDTPEGLVECSDTVS